MTAEAPARRGSERQGEPRRRLARPRRQSRVRPGAPSGVRNRAASVGLGGAGAAGILSRTGIGGLAGGRRRAGDRKSGGEGKKGAGRGEPGGRRDSKKKK